MQIKNAAFLAGCILALAADANGQQSTAFSYQGRLSSSNGPVSGSFDLQFTLFNAVTNGGLVAGPITNVSVVVTNGLFTSLIDFGSTPFSGTDLWLDIGVRTNGASSGFLLLRPRQRISASPYAIRAAGVADGAITASKLSSGPGANGAVLKMNGGVLAWGTDLNSGGGVSLVGSGTGLVGGPITGTGTLSIDTTVVPRLNAGNTFSAGPQTLQSGGAANKGLVVRGAASQAANLQEWQDSGSGILASVSPSGVFTGNGANLTSLNAGNLSAGTVSDTRLSGNVALLNGNQVFANSNTFNGGVALINVANRVVGTFFGNGAGLSNVTATVTNVTTTLAGDVTGTTSASTVARIRGVNVSTTLPLSNQLLRYNGTSWTPGAVGLTTDVSGSLPVANGGTGASTAASARTGLGAAASGVNADITSLSALTTPLTAVQGGSGQSAYTVGDVLYANSTVSLARLPDVLTGNALISGGAGVAPSWGKIGLATHVSGSLPIANGGTGGSTAAGARTSLGVAASGANLDITSLGGLITPISPSQGGSGLSSFAIGDLLYASGVGTLARRAIGADGLVLGSSAGLPTWVAANTHNHFGQTWSGTASDGLFVQNSANASGASAVTGSATDATGINYGVYGQTLSSSGIGVQGTAFASSGTATGVSGQSTSSTGIGVYGLASATTGTPTGVYGEAASTNGIGVYGIGTGSTGVPVGVYGEAVSATGYGLYTPNRLFVGGTAFIGGHLSMQPIARIFADVGSAVNPPYSFTTNSTSGMFSAATNVLGFSTSSAERMRIAADGKVGIGRTPTANVLEVAGEASKNTAGSWFANSDRRIKTDIQDLPGALETIERIRPVSFKYTQEYRDNHPGVEDKTYYNVVAQEFAKVFPESVKDSGEVLDGKPVMQVDTHPAMIYTIAAVQELHRLVEAKDSELAQLKEQNARLEKRLNALEKVAEGLEREKLSAAR